MKAIGKTVLGLAAVLLLAGPSAAQDGDPDRVRDPIYGAQLMSPAERAAYRERLRSMSPSQRARFRQEHRQRMDQRARERGVQLKSRRRPGSDEGRGSRGGGSMGGGRR